MGIISESSADQNKNKSKQNTKPYKPSNVINLEIEKKIEPINEEEPLVLSRDFNLFYRPQEKPLPAGTENFI